jgi:hypothetical protein
MKLVVFLCFLALSLQLCGCESVVKADHNARLTAITYLQQEQASCSHSQQNLLKFLRSHKIPIGSEQGSLRNSLNSAGFDRIEDRVITSTMENPVECRISLDKAPPGSKCISPCLCSGSQKWVQFSVINKLRRKDPASWKICQTCRTPYRFDLFTAYSPVSASLIGLMLDQIQIIRGMVFTVAAIFSYLIQLPSLLLGYLVSKSFWQNVSFFSFCFLFDSFFSQYPRFWSKFTRLPFPFKFWIGKMVVATVWEKYLMFEKNIIVSKLADVETKLIEKNLPDLSTATAESEESIKR